jgi:O-acetyl-ADP-ribose deacetylase (regulator of RNase III)
MRIEFCVPDRHIFNTVEAILAGTPGLTVRNTSITNGSYAALISAGNSFAEMNGGVDGIVCTHLSAYTPAYYIQDKVKECIAKTHAGELPVGEAVVVEVQHPMHTRLIYAPTMRVPEDVSETLNAYLAFRGALVAMRRHGIEAASAPLFCTSAGCMPVERAVRQMRAAYLSVCSGELVGKDWLFYHENDRSLKRL